MQVFLHRDTPEEECYLNMKQRRMAVQDKRTKKMTLKQNVPQPAIDRYYNDALAGANGWEVIYDYTDDKKLYPI